MTDVLPFLERKTHGLISGPAIIVSAPIFFDWRPWKLTYKIIVRSRDGGEVLWMRPFLNRHDAVMTWARLYHIDINERLLGPVYLPGSFFDGDLEYIFASVTTFNASNVDGAHDWVNGGNVVPARVSFADYLIVGQAGGGGGVALNSAGGGGGGAGGLKTANLYAVTAGSSLTITVGAAAGTGGAVGGNAGVAGSDSVFDTITAHGGGGGGGGGNNAGSGGSGGGAYVANPGGAGTGGEGNTGGTGNASSNAGAGGGGGAGAVGGVGTGSQGGVGGAGTVSTITGSSIFYAGGGGGGTFNGGSQGGGVGGGGNGHLSAGTGIAGTDNLGGGGGGGGCDPATGGAGGLGGKGVIILSWAQPPIPYSPIMQLGPIQAM